MPRTTPQLQEILAYAQNIVDTIRDPLVILDGDLHVRSANRSFYRLFQVTAQETVDRPLTALGGGQWDIPELLTLLTETLADRDAFDDFETVFDLPDLGERTLLLNGRKLRRPESDITLLVLSLEDITERKALGAALAVEQDQDKQIALAVLRPMLFQPVSDAFSGITVQTAYAMASDEALVGGDFWDTFAYDHGHVGFVLGDVMGHGMTSAIFTTELKHTLRAYIREHEQPTQVMYHMNRFLYQSNRLFTEGVNTEGSDAPVCVTLANIERETGAGSVSIGGMEPPIIVRADGRTEQMTAVGMPLGIVANEEYRQMNFQLEPGDTLILFTDGVTEARRGKAFLDVEGLMRLAVEGNQGSLKDMADTIMKGARDFAGGKLTDDASIVLVRRTATSPIIEPRKLSDP